MFGLWFSPMDGWIIALQNQALAHDYGADVRIVQPVPSRVGGQTHRVWRHFQAKRSTGCSPTPPTTNTHGDCRAGPNTLATLRNLGGQISPQPCWWLCNQARGAHGLVVGLPFDSVIRRYWDATNNLHAWGLKLCNAVGHVPSLSAVPSRVGC